MEIVNIADIVDPDDVQGRTYRQVNKEKTHAIPLGALCEVNIDYSEYYRMRGYVVSHDRDCDGTPLYSLGPKGYEAKLAEHLPHERKHEYDASEEMQIKKYLHHLQRQHTWSGFCDDSLIVIFTPEQMQNDSETCVQAVSEWSAGDPEQQQSRISDRKE